jgi:putative heme-binding domain-containing protein
LKSIGKKDKEYLLRSIVDPGAEVAKGFGVITVGLKDGTSLSGVEGDDTDGTLEILAVDGSAKIVNKDQIQSRSAPISTMPPMGYVLTKRELRDVIAYLSERKD